MILMMIVWSIFFTGTDLLTSNTITPKGKRKLSEVQKIKTALKKDPAAANAELRTLPVAGTQPTTPTQPQVESRTATPQEIEQALHLAKLVHSKNSALIGSLPQRIAASYLNRINVIRNSIANYENASSFYQLLLSKDFNNARFISSINQMFGTDLANFTESGEVTQPADVFEYFISDIFESMVESYIYAHIWSSTAELFLKHDLQLMIEKNHLFANQILGFLIKLVTILTDYKKEFLDNENKDITLTYFQKALPIDTWIGLTQKLAFDIKSALPTIPKAKTEEEKKENKKAANINVEQRPTRKRAVTFVEDNSPENSRKTKRDAQQLPQERKRVVTFADNNDVQNLQTEEETSEKLFELLQKRNEQAKLAKLPEHSEILSAQEKILKELAKDKNLRFTVLEDREKTIKLPTKLKELGDLLETMHILLKKDPFNNELFTLLLDEVYALLMDKDNAKLNPIKEDNTPYYDTYIINSDLDSNEYYIPLYDIIIFKLNTLLKAYAIKNGQINLDKKINITVDFLISPTEEKTYSFSASINDLQKYNENAYFNWWDGSPTLAELAHPTSWTETLKSAGHSVLNVGATILNNSILLPFRLARAGWNRLYYGSEEYQQEQNRIQAEIEKNRKIRAQKRDQIIKSHLNSSAPTKNSARPDTENVIAQPSDQRDRWDDMTEDFRPGNRRSAAKTPVTAQNRDAREVRRLAKSIWKQKHPNEVAIPEEELRKIEERVRQLQENIRKGNGEAQTTRRPNAEPIPARVSAITPTAPKPKANTIPTLDELFAEVQREHQAPTMTITPVTPVVTRNLTPNQLPTSTASAAATQAVAPREIAERRQRGIQELRERYTAIEHERQALLDATRPNQQQQRVDSAQQLGNAPVVPNARAATSQDNNTNAARTAAERRNRRPEATADLRALLEASRPMPRPNQQRRAQIPTQQQAERTAAVPTNTTPSQQRATLAPGSISNSGTQLRNPGQRLRTSQATATTNNNSSNQVIPAELASLPGQRADVLAERQAASTSATANQTVTSTQRQDPQPTGQQQAPVAKQEPKRFDWTRAILGNPNVDSDDDL